ncbi:ABC transporter ATP-binding protein [Actinomadura sp. KC06]|uniref:ABC transporter ATP-binding protein n=1 Tax=Actinomadura sp. KC06 TaxID=2530369 RepID=UPI001A9E26E6|nr:ABC transporter ATP-binding protein [Actinomadura sp. KC06]
MRTPPAGKPLVMRGIVKRYGDVRALDGVDLELRPGEVHALLGENGAGKTTLMNVLYGMTRPDAGTIEIGGRAVRFAAPRDAAAEGIGMVHQHFMLVPTLTVAENMVLGRPGGLFLGRRRLAAVADRLAELARRYELDVDPHAKVWQLSVGEQQRVEILRALYHEARVLILDEPTSTLAPVESERLFPRLRAMAREGAAVVFITHHLGDVMRWADRITVLRRGTRVGVLDPAATSEPELARLMVGRDVGTVAPRTGPSVRKETVLTVDGIRANGDRGPIALHDVSFTVAAGEIVAIAGVEGNGQPELEEVLTGLRAPAAGRVLLDGRDVTDLPPGARLGHGLGLVPSDRNRRGIVGGLSVAENLVLDRIGRAPFGTPLRVSRQAIEEHGAAEVERFSIAVSSPAQLAGTLSGGNAQRTVLARALSAGLRCLVAAQPTRGLDVGAIEFVWERLAEARAAGLAVLLISTDLDEVMSIADRCCVLYRGRLVASWPREDLDREQIGLAMGGALNHPPQAPDAAEAARSADDAPSPDFEEA